MTAQHVTSNLIRSAKVLLSSLVLGAAIASPASAHLMVAQHGTLNIKDNGVFMVLSLPVTAFENIDDDDDGKMSMNEFTKHRLDISSVVNKNVVLSDSLGPRPLQGLMLTPIASHTSPNEPMEQLVIMGRFDLSNSNPDLKSANIGELKFQADLFGKNTTEQSLTVSTTRKQSANSETEKTKVVLTPQKPESKLFKNG